MPKGFSQKDPFQDLSPEFKDAVDGSTRAEIKTRITQVMKAEAQNQRNKREDLQVQEAKIKKDKLEAPYKARKADARLAAKIAAQKDHDEDATDAALELAQAEDDAESDNDLFTAKEEYSLAASTYTDATKENNLKIAYALRALKLKGAA